MPQAWARVRSWSRAPWRARQLDAEMHEEMRFHIEMETEAGGVVVNQTFARRGRAGTP